MNESHNSEKPRRVAAWKRWSLRLGIVFAVIFASILLYTGMTNCRASEAIHTEVQAGRKAREPLNWDELARTDRQGYVAQVNGPSADSEISRTYAQAMEAAAAWKDGPGVEFHAALKHAEKPNPREIDQLADSMKGFQKALDLFEKAAKLEGLAIVTETAQADFDKQAQHFQLMRTSARMLAARALVAAAQGHGDEAAEWCIVLCHFTRAMPGERLISGLVSIAIQHVICETILTSQEWAPSSPAQTRELMAALAGLQTDTPLPRMFCGERVTGMALFQENTALASAPDHFKRPNQAEYMKLMRQTIAAARKPFPDSMDTMDALAKVSRPPLISNLAPALSAAFTQAARLQAEVRVVHVSLALRLAHSESGVWPGNLKVLVPKYVDKLPLDPFTGKPLLYKLSGAGCSVYSTGDDRDDNGGLELTAANIKYGPGTDIIVNLSE